MGSILIGLFFCIRPNEALKRIFTEAGLTVVKEGVQQGLPAGLFTVRM
jgi:protein N-terminal methyltransferase